MAASGYPEPADAADASFVIPAETMLTSSRRMPIAIIVLAVALPCMTGGIVPSAVAARLDGATPDVSDLENVIGNRNSRPIFAIEYFARQATGNDFSDAFGDLTTDTRNNFTVELRKRPPRPLPGAKS